MFEFELITKNIVSGDRNQFEWSKLSNNRNGNNWTVFYIMKKRIEEFVKVNQIIKH